MKQEFSPETQAEIDEGFKRMKEKEDAWFSSWNATGNEKISAGLAYKAFLEKEDRAGFNFYKAPIARKSFMMGYILAYRNINPTPQEA